jgi:hypothetical protein
MSTEQKVRIGILALGTVLSVVAAAHFGHLAVKIPFLEEIGGAGGS